MAGTDDINVRNYVIEQLRPFLPKAWKLQPFNGLPDTIDRVTVVLSLEEYTRHKIQGHREVAYVLTVIEPKTEPGKADDALDESVVTLLNALDIIARDSPAPDAVPRWTSAKRGVASGQPGFDIHLLLPIRVNELINPTTPEV